MFEVAGPWGFVLYAVIGLLGLALFVMSVRRIHYRTCIVCEYDLRGHPADALRCPECGAKIVDVKLIKQQTVVSIGLAVLGSLLMLGAGGILFVVMLGN